MYKTTLTAMTLALAGVFMAAGPAEAAIADWEFGATVGNCVDFYEDGGAWTPRSTAGLGQDTTWGEVAPEDDWDYNDPRLRGEPSRNESFWQPLQGEVIYSPDTDVFNLDPWHVGPGLSGLRPSEVSEDIQFAGIWEFQLNGPTNGGDSAADLQEVLDGYGSMPANFNSSWRLNLSNRSTTPDTSSGSEPVAFDWEFDLNQHFDELDDFSTEPLTAWYADSVHADTWSGFHLLRDGSGGLTNRGYMLLATNNSALFPWNSSFAARDYSEWDTFTDSGEGADYYHVGVTGTEGSGRLEVVPEPATMTLLGLGLAGFVTRRFMTRKKA